MRPAPQGRDHQRGIADRFRRNRSGSVAIEFAMLAIPFCLLVFAILETCISFASQQVMANATDDVARLLRTGQVRAADVSEDSLKELICQKLSVTVSEGCPGLEVHLEEVPDFATAADKMRIEISGNEIVGSGTINPGGSMTKNILRVFYRWPVMTDFMRASMSNMEDNTTLHFAGVTWQNEPFDE